MPSTAIPTARVSGLVGATERQMLPIGSSRTVRTYETRISEYDNHSLYSGTSAVTPGPGAYEPRPRRARARARGGGDGGARALPVAHARALARRRARAGLWHQLGGAAAGGARAQAHGRVIVKAASTGTMATACARASRPRRRTRWTTAIISPRPGPGEYGNSDAGVAHAEGAPCKTFDGAQKLHDGVAGDAEEALRLRVSGLDYRIRGVRDGLKGFDRLPADKQRLVKLEAATSLARMVRERKEALAKLAEHRAGHPHLGAAKRERHARPRSVPMNNTSDRFFHPLESKRTALATPGPGEHHEADEYAKFGTAKMTNTTKFSKQQRPTDRDAPISKSLLVIRHNQFGYPYFSYQPDLGPGEYTPNMLPSVETV